MVKICSCLDFQFWTSVARYLTRISSPYREARAATFVIQSLLLMSCGKVCELPARFWRSPLLFDQILHSRNQVADTPKWLVFLSAQYPQLDMSILPYPLFASCGAWPPGVVVYRKAFQPRLTTGARYVPILTGFDSLI